MGNSINISIFLPTIPLGITLFIFILLRAFNRTINRLTKPISFLALFSVLSSTVLSIFCLLKNIEGELYLSDYLFFIHGKNLEIHLNALNEKIIIFIGLISSLLLIFSFIKLPRQKGYVLYITTIGFLTSILIFSSLIFDIKL